MYMSKKGAFFAPFQYYQKLTELPLKSTTSHGKLSVVSIASLRVIPSRIVRISSPFLPCLSIPISTSFVIGLCCFVSWSPGSYVVNQSPNPVLPRVLLKWSNYRRESVTNPSMITSGKDVTVGESFGDELRLSVNCTDELSYIPDEIFLEYTFTRDAEIIAQSV